MAVYLIAEIRITDDAWVPDYAAGVHPIVHKHGGRYLARSGSITAVEGEAPDASLVAVLEFPTRQALDAFVNDPEYAPFGKARQAGSVSRFYAIDDTDLAGSIPYLGKG
jgi:uncharacterized protein (DUF1330 family)